jgi:hypothetical protein
MIKFLIVLTTVLVSACSTIPRYGARQAGEAFDELLTQAEFFVCQGASVGAIQRRYRTSQEYQAWQNFCAVQAQRDGNIAQSRIK